MSITISVAEGATHCAPSAFASGVLRSAFGGFRKGHYTFFTPIKLGIADYVKTGLTNSLFCDMIAHNSAKRRKTHKGEHVPIVSPIVVLLISLLLIVKEPLPVGRT